MIETIVQVVVLLAWIGVGFYVGYRRGYRYRDVGYLEGRTLGWKEGGRHGDAQSNTAYRIGFDDGWIAGYDESQEERIVEWEERIVEWYVSYDKGYEDGVNDTRNETVSGSEAPE
jgi:hypothetical protein